MNIDLKNIKTSFLVVIEDEFTFEALRTHALIEGCHLVLFEGPSCKNGVALVIKPQDTEKFEPLLGWAHDILARINRVEMPWSK